MKNIFLFPMIFALCVFAFVGCGSEIQSSELSDYLAWNTTTTKILDRNFNLPLPDKLTANEYCDDYYYAYSQSVLGDPNFVIQLVLHFSNAEDFNAHTDRLGLQNSAYIQAQDDKYYMIQGTEQDIVEYTDDETYDGLYFDYGVIVINEKCHKVTYIAAHVWDYWKNDVLINWLMPIHEA